MPIELKKSVVMSKAGDAVRRTRTEVPEYLRHAIKESVQRGRDDARTHSAAKHASAFITHGRDGRIKGAK